ncbi:MAG: PocR ligand-binding domain-containing protein [Clostridia bacterium]|nr:PocR ligand-binding domain-containing protein [Clostridia bacterium]
MLDIVRKELESVAIDFYNTTKIKIVLYGEAGRKPLYSYPDDMCSLCKTLRGNKEVTEKCFECDHIGFENCRKVKGVYIYKCHAGLTEAMAPICENSVIIGYIMLGQILDKKDVEYARERVTEISLKYGYNVDEMLSKLSKVKCTTTEAIQSAANIMSMCACYLYTNKIIKNKTDILSYQLKDYVDTHLSDDLSVKTLCNVFYISKTKLYYLAKDAFNIGISDYIRNKRLEEAKKLLTETKKPLYQIAEETGLGDANYFSRNFKSSVGISPKEYRKNSNSEKHTDI